MLLSKAQAYDLGMVKRVRIGYCACCGRRPAAPGRIMCHECRADCDLYEQPALLGDTEEEKTT